jgi:hypothetical protein
MAGILTPAEFEGGGGGTVPGQKIGKQVYAPATQATPAVTTTTMAAFDTANIQTGLFTVPPSGAVTVRVSFSGKANASGAWAALGLALHGTASPLVASEWECELPTGDSQFPFFIEFTVTGRTPGASESYDLVGCVTTGDTFTINAIGKTTVTPSLNGVNQGGPVTFTVTAD